MTIDIGNYVGNVWLLSYGSRPMLVLSGTETSGVKYAIRENAGVIELGIVTIADGPIVTWTTTLTTLYPTVADEKLRHSPETSATTDWEESQFQAPANSAWTVIDVGIIPDASFGQATNYATLTLVNKGASGVGNTTVATKAFSSAAIVFAKNSFGSLVNPNIAANEVLTMKKTHAGSGQIVPASMFYIVLKRIS